MTNEQLPSNNSPISVSEPTSAVQTESESSDGSSDADDDKSSEQSPTESEQSADEKDQSVASDDEDKVDYESEAKEKSVDGDDIGSQQSELVANAADQNEDKASIDLDEIRYKNLKIIYGGRDILDFSSNVANKSWYTQYAHLPEKNYQMYINNRSQYNRLASGYEHPEHYALNKCGKCMFPFPVLVDIADKADQPPVTACKSGVSELLTQTLATIVTRDSPIQNLSALAQKLSAQSVASSIHAPTAHSMNLNNFMLSNNGAAAAATSGQSYNAYQHQNQNRNQFATNNTNNHTCYKQNQAANAFYGNNVVLNALVNQIGNNINNSSAFNANFMNALNGTNNNNNNGNAGNNTNQLNQLSNAALANLMNQNRQQQLYGMCRQNINKSGINFNANSHKSMPTYSHF